MGDGRACPDDVAHADTPIASGREVARSATPQLVAHDAHSANAVMQAVERGALELLKARGNQSAGSPQNSIEPLSETDV